MKFGKELRARLYTPWLSNYVCYKKLKQIIKRSTNPRLSDSEQDDLKAEFFTKINSSLNRAERFYTSMAKELSLTHSRISQYDRAHRGDYRTAKAGLMVQWVLSNLRRNIELLERLQEFCILNCEGFRKIVKKWDKRTDDTELPLFMEKVRATHMFSHKALDRLVSSAKDTLGSVEELIAAPTHRELEGGNIGVLVQHNEHTYMVPMSPLLLPKQHPDATPLSLEGETALIFSRPESGSDEEFHDFLLEPESDPEDVEGLSLRGLSLKAEREGNKECVPMEAGVTAERISIAAEVESIPCVQPTLCASARSMLNPEALSKTNQPAEAGLTGERISIAVELETIFRDAANSILSLVSCSTGDAAQAPAADM